MINYLKTRDSKKQFFIIFIIKKNLIIQLLEKMKFIIELNENNSVTERKIINIINGMKIK